MKFLRTLSASHSTGASVTVASGKSGGESGGLGGLPGTLALVESATY